MKNSPYEKIYSLIKRYSKITTILTIISITIPALALFRKPLLALWKYMISWCINHPLFSGVMISWLVAFFSTFIVLLFAYLNRGKRDQYEEIFKKYKIWLVFISIVVLFYISINLASEALTGEGVPILSESYQIGPFTNVSYQDVFLISPVFIIIFLVFLVAPRYRESKLIFAFLIIVLIIVLLFSPLFLFHCHKKDIPETYLFSWDSVPGDDNEKLIRFLRDDLNISWAENAEIRKSNDGMTISISKDENSAEIMMDEKKENAILKISDDRTYDLKVKTENGKLNIYPKSEPPIRLFFISTVVGTLLSVLFYLKIPVKEDSLDLFFYFSVIPAFIVASLVLIGHELVTFPNIAGHVVVGFLFISGFVTLVILTMVFLKDARNGVLVWRFTVVASLAAISFFSMLFLLLEPHIYRIDTFRKILTFFIAITLVILPYGFLYEKMLKYRFTEWWRREWKPIAMIISILAILIISAINPDHKLFKLLGIVIALCFVVFLPLLLGMWKFRKNIKFRKFKLRLPNLRYLFIWNNVPVNDSKRLQKYLKDDCKIDWAEKAEICKSYDGKTIRLSKDEKSAQITIDEEEKKVTLKIGDGEPFDLDGEMKNGRLMIRRHIPKKPLRFTLPKFMLPKYQGMVLVKAETGPGKLKEVVKGLDDMEGEGVYQTMVVRGEYDVCLIVEGVSSDDIAEKILRVRKINGVASTTTLTDFREFFDREVK